MEIIILILFLLGGLSLKLVLFFLERRKWNNGTHKDCGGKWKYIDTYPIAGEGHIHGYRCDKCRADLSSGTFFGKD